MKKYLLFAIALLFLACSEDKESTYNYFPSEKTEYNMYNYENNTIFKVEYREYLVDLEFPNRYGYTMKMRSKIFKIKFNEEELMSYYFYYDNQNYSILLHSDLEDFSEEVLASGKLSIYDKPTNNKLRIDLQNDYYITLTLNKGITSIEIKGTEYIIG